MRTYAQIVPTFWTRGSGKKLRGKPFAQVLALYFMTGSAANMLGLYYVPRLTILNDTGIPDSELDAALAAVAGVEIAFYDPDDELVYLPEGAAHQVGETLHPKDTKRKTILGALKMHGNHPFALKWLARYYEPYGLAQDGLRCPIDTPSHTPSIPYLGTASTPGSVRVPDPVPDRISEARVGAETPALVADLASRATVWRRDPTAGSLQYPNPELWAETVELNALVASTFGTDPDVLSGSDNHGRIDQRVKCLLDRWADGVPQARMRDAVRGAALDEWIKNRPQLQSMQTIFKDGNAIDKYCRLAKSKKPAPPRVAPTRGAPDPDEEFLAKETKARLARAHETATPQELADAEGTAKSVTRLAATLFKPNS